MEREGEQQSQDQEVREEPERRTTAGAFKVSAWSKKTPELRLAIELSVTGIFKRR